MIVAVGSDKGSPGATTLAVLLGLFWSGERLVCELDPRGADLPFRLCGVDGRPLATSPSIATLAVDTRPGAGSRSLLIYAQHSALGVPVIPGEVSPTRLSGLTPHLPAIVTAAAAWPAAVIADLGCLQPWNPSLLVARAGTVVVLVTRADTESLGHLRDRVAELAAYVGGPHRLRSPVAVVVRAEPRDGHAAVDRVEKLLASIGSPALVVGSLVDDAAGAKSLWSGALTRRDLRRPLFTSARTVYERLRRAWPELSEPIGAAVPEWITTSRSAVTAVRP